SFTQLTVGGSIDREHLRPRYASSGSQWRVEDNSAATVDIAELGWTISELPSGFRRITSVRRDSRTGHPINQVVVSDGLAAVSVFIEPYAGKSPLPRLGLSRQGAVNVYSRKVDDYLVTAVGEVPAQSVRLIADAVERRPSR
ncbi:MAG: transcriptional regulator, partial [Gammaproteobacteria bacterium]|nr:transcriptional regulator [Gammaproteobacteria bacterium]